MEQKIFLINKDVLKASSQLGRDHIVSCGINLGKITKTGRGSNSKKRFR